MEVEAVVEVQDSEGDTIVVLEEIAMQIVRGLLASYPLGLLGHSSLAVVPANAVDSTIDRNKEERRSSNIDRNTTYRAVLWLAKRSTKQYSIAF